MACKIAIKCYDKNIIEATDRCNSVKTVTAHPDPSVGVASLPIITADQHRLIKAYTPMSDLY